MSFAMIAPSSKLISASELRRLTVGSLEQRIAFTTEAVRAHFDNDQAVIVATQPDQVVVSIGEDFYKVVIQESESGSLIITESALIEVEVFDKANVRPFVVREAKAVVDLFLRGAREAAVDRLMGLGSVIHLDTGYDVLESDEALHEVEEALNTDRMWMAIYQQRRDFIRSFIGAKVAELEEAMLRPKFEKLYDDEAIRSGSEEHFDEIDEGLTRVLDRLLEVRDTVVAASNRVRVPLSEPDADNTLLMFEGFATDLIHDLGTLHEIGSRAMSAAPSARVRGKLHDLLANGLCSREIACGFVVAVADRLIEDR